MNDDKFKALWNAYAGQIDEDQVDQDQVDQVDQDQADELSEQKPN